MSEQQYPRYPDIKVQLTGEDGNAFFILGKVIKALKRAGVLEQEIHSFKEEATSGDYDNLLVVAMNWVEVS